MPAVRAYPQPEAPIQNVYLPGDAPRQPKVKDLFAPPAAVSWYHVPSLEAAAAGHLRYDMTRYPIHGLVNNAVVCIWYGLLADANGPGPVLTGHGSRLLEDWYRAHPGHTPLRDRIAQANAPERQRSQASVRTGTGHPAQRAVCACQWGATGHCTQGNHDRCHAEQVAGPRPETYLVSSDGTCVMDAGHPVKVWPAGRPCRWMCACDCHTAPSESPPSEPAQLTLF